MINKILQGDSLAILKTLPDKYFDCVVTSPPYWALRNYEVAGQLGLEKTPEDYILKMVELFREVRRVMKNEATFWLNIGDTYFGGGRNRGNTKQVSAKQASRLTGTET